MARKDKQRVPNEEEALKGIPVALATAQAHLDCAALLAEKGFAGPARSFLILSIEESEKARTLGQIALGEPLTEPEILARLYTHRARHGGALRKSWSRGATGTYVAESLRERLTMKPERSDPDRWAAVLAHHPEALPVDWPELAGDLREGGFYSDLKEDDQWHGPDKVPMSDYDILLPAAVHLLSNASAAYEHELRARGHDIAGWRPLPSLPDSPRAESTKGASTDKYIVERRHHGLGWLAWTDRAGAVEPILYAGWGLERSDNAFSDDPSGLMMLSHSILSDSVGDPRTYDDAYRDDRGEHQSLWRRFFEEQLLPIRPGERREISAEQARAWSERQAELAPGH
jgi:AbiV family abortive infection protein